MSQQLQQPPTQQSVQQPTQQSAQAGGGVGQQSFQQGGGQQSFQQSAPPEIQEAVTTLDHFETVSEWAKTKALQRGIPQVAQKLDDLTEIANLQKKLFLRQSPYAEAVSQATTRSIQQSVQDLQTYASEVGVQDVITEAQYLTDTIGQASVQAQQWSQQGMVGGASGQQAFGGVTGQQGGIGQQGMAGGGAAGQQPTVGTGSQFQSTGGLEAQQTSGAIGQQGSLGQQGGLGQQKQVGQQGGLGQQGGIGQQKQVGQGTAGTFGQESGGLGAQQY